MSITALTLALTQVHKWSELYASFDALMGNRRIKKHSLGVGGDVGRIVKRFDIDASRVAGGVEVRLQTRG